MFKSVAPLARNGARNFSASSPASMKVVGVFYKGGKHAKEQPKLLGTIENQLGESSGDPQ